RRSIDAPGAPSRSFRSGAQAGPRPGSISPNSPRARQASCTTASAVLRKNAATTPPQTTYSRPTRSADCATAQNTARQAAAPVIHRSVAGRSSETGDRITGASGNSTVGSSVRARSGRNPSAYAALDAGESLAETSDGSGATCAAAVASA